MGIKPRQFVEEYDFWSFCFFFQCFLEKSESFCPILGMSIHAQLVVECKVEVNELFFGRDIVFACNAKDKLFFEKFLYEKGLYLLKPVAKLQKI